MSVKDLIKKIPGLQPMVRGAKAFVKEAQALPNYLAEQKLQRPDGPIKVGFLCQYIPSWHYMSPTPATPYWPHRTTG